MQANWSLILNVLLLIGVIIAIGRLMQARRQSLNFRSDQGAMEKKAPEAPSYSDDIIAVRKVSSEAALSGKMVVEKASMLRSDQQQQITIQDPLIRPFARGQDLRTPRGEGNNEGSYLEEIQPFKKTTPRLMPQDEGLSPLKIQPKMASGVEMHTAPSAENPPTLMMFLLAKENRQFAGYELLQTVLTSGLRFGEGHLFHRHQFANGQGPVLCSLAAATATGVFDLQNIGGFSVHGLCLYMHSSKNPGIDMERFSVMLETARQLSEGLDAHLLDDQRKPLTDERIARYYRLLQIDVRQSNIIQRTGAGVKPLMITDLGA